MGERQTIRFRRSAKRDSELKNRNLDIARNKKFLSRWVTVNLLAIFFLVHSQCFKCKLSFTIIFIVITSNFNFNSFRIFRPIWSRRNEELKTEMFCEMFFFSFDTETESWKLLSRKFFCTFFYSLSLHQHHETRHVCRRNSWMKSFSVAWDSTLSRRMVVNLFCNFVFVSYDDAKHLRDNAMCFVQL